MTQENKDLLLKDLCARLPYGVKVEITHWRNRDKDMMDSKIYRVPLDVNKASVLIKPTSDVRPYLFPLSSMTEEERIEIGNEFAYGHPHKAIDTLHKNHIDYRGLIEKGLAIDATGLNVY